MDYSVRSGPREQLVATLRQLADDRGRRDETHGRAAEARAAADALEQGDEQVLFERGVYVVGDSDRHSLVIAERAQLLERLKHAAVGWDHQDKPQLVAQAVDGYERVEQGAEMVRVGHLLYVVDE